VEIRVRSLVPAGCGAGTSASVAVALVGALAAARSESLSARDVAYAAHRLEVEVLGQESGIQDQLSAASGGISYLEIDPYPEARVETLPSWAELGPRLSLVFLGRPHDSSSVHRQVIEDVRTQRSIALSRLRDAAGAARDAVLGQDLAAFGQAMIANTEAQRALHPELVGPDAHQVFEAAAAKAIGWKVNGAGGRGGSVTILHATPTAKATFDARVATLQPSYRVVPIEISPVGLQIRDEDG
jgi:D-glycero-alpha-D-manno-heptose-7-phosphate kinase